MYELNMLPAMNALPIRSVRAHRTDYSESISAFYAEKKKRIKFANSKVDNRAEHLCLWVRIDSLWVIWYVRRESYRNYMYCNLCSPNFR